MISTANANGVAKQKESPPKTKLFPVHLKELSEGSGLTLETIEQAGIYSEGDCRKLAIILDRKKVSPKMLGGLVFPFYDETGAVVMRRVKPTNPPTYSGRIAKYLSPKGSVVRAYFPPPIFHRLTDPKSPLFITEGEKKSLCATQNGFHCIGLTGVEGWHKKGSIWLCRKLQIAS